MLWIDGEFYDIFEDEKNLQTANLKFNVKVYYLFNLITFLKM